LFLSAALDDDLQAHLKDKETCLFHIINMSDLRVDCKAIERSYLYAEEDREVWNVSSVWHRDAKGASKRLTTLDDAGNGVARIVNGVIAVFEAKTMSEERKVCLP